MLSKKMHYYWLICIFFHLLAFFWLFIMFRIFVDILLFAFIHEKNKSVDYDEEYEWKRMETLK